MILLSGLRPGASSCLALGALALALSACGDDGNTTLSASVTGSSTDNASSSSTSVTPTTGTGTTVDEPTVGTNSMSASGTESTTDPTATGTSTSTGPTDPTTGDTTDTGTTMPAQTDTGTSTTDGTSTGTTADDTTGTTADTSTGDDTTEGVEPCVCPDLEVPLDDGIFVLSDNSELYKYFPETKQFQELGTFNCGGMTNTFSMAVDRLGFAWVMFNTPQGEIWKLDVTNVDNCEDPGYNPGQMGINYFGMAFVSNSKFDSCDQLYGNTFDGGFNGFTEGPNFGDFITLDPNLQVQKLGDTTFNGAELTGTGDGRAFMFGGANPSKLVEVDKKTGAYLETTPLPGLELTNAFAFAFFAGDFYMFTETDNGIFSKVTHFDYDDSDNNGVQDLTTVVAQAPIRIVGAGVSTCAPFVPM